MAETAPLLPSASTHVREEETSEDWHHKVGELLESKRTHRFLLTLIAIDAVFVLMDLAWNILNPNCEGGEKDEAPEWLERLALFSLLIDFLFFIEIPMSLYAFGPQFFGLSTKKKPVPHYVLHLFDAIVIILTITLEVILKGKERELAGLLVVLRLWRIVKLVGATAVGVGEWDEEAVTTVDECKTRIKELLARNSELAARNEVLLKEVVFLRNLDHRVARELEEA